MRAAATALIVFSVGLSVGLGGAHAIKAADFDDLARGTTRVASADAVRHLAWSFTGSCKGSQPGFDANQCEVLKRTVRAKDAVKSFKVEVAAPVLKNGKKLTVYGCLNCASDNPITIGSGKVVRDGQTVLGPALKTATKNVTEEVAGRAMTEFVFRLTSKGTPQLSGFRTYDPCTGEILVAQPRSDDRNPSKKCDSTDAKN